MRSEGETPSACEETDVKVICALEEADGEYKDCPVACRASESDEPTDVVVKSGDLAVTAKPAEGRKVLKSGISDLDTLTFATSEEVEISKITLELYGYTANSDTIKGVWLEDADGNVIADAKTLTKDKVTLAIKKDYRKVDGKFVATVVVQTENAAGTLGFKVVKDGVVSTAENLNVDDYTPYTYEVIDYQGSTVTVTVKGSDKDYNYEEGNSYEIARFKVTAGTKDVLVKGFTLTNKGKLDMGEFLDELTVTVDSKEIKANASVNKDEELVISFDDVAINMNKSALFVLSASFKDFDDYGEAVQYYLADEADFNAVESKNGTRVQVNNAAANGVIHTFKGGKIKLSNTKLGNVDAAQASEGNVVAEGKITVTEPISKLSFSVVADANAQYIDTLTLVVNGEDYEAEKMAKAYSFTSYDPAGDCATQWATGKVRVISTGANSTTVEVIENSVLGFVGQSFTVEATTLTANQCYELKQGTKVIAKGKITDANEYAFGFKNVSIDESGKVQFLADIKDNPAATGKVINFKSNLGKNAFEGARYDNSNKDVAVADVAGSISFSKVTIQAAKAALENNLTKAVEFLTGETARKVVFDGTYTAKKGEVNLNKVQISGTTPNNHVTFYVSIDGEEVTDADLNVEETFSDVKVKAGDSVKVVVEAEVEGYNGVEDPMPTFTIELKGTDANGNEDTGRGSDTLVAMKVKASGTTTISAGSAKSTVLLKAKNQTIAEFIVKPSNASDEGLTLDTLKFAIAADDSTAIGTGDIRVKVAGTEIDEDGTNTFTYAPNEELSAEGVKVEIILKKEIPSTVRVSAIQVNGGAASSREFSKRFENAVVTVTAQENKGDYTKYTVEVDEYDSTFVVSNLKFYVNSGATCADADIAAPTTCKEVASLASVEDGLTLEADNGETTQSITAIKYTVAGSNTPVVIYKAAFEDYFKVGSDTLRVYSNK